MTETVAQGAQAPELSQKERFFRYFQHEITVLQEQIDDLTNLASTGGERSDATDHCLAGIARLSNEVKDASVYLPAYDQRTYAEAIKALQEKLAETKATFAPRQRFTFKTARKNPSAVSVNDTAELAAQRGRLAPGLLSPGSSSNESSFATTPNYLRTPNPDGPVSAALPTSSVLDTAADALWADEEDPDPEYPEPGKAIRRPTFSRVQEVVLDDQAKVHIIVPTAAAHATMPASITRVKQSVVDIAAPTENGKPFASLTIKNVRKSALICGSVNGPAHITNVKHSVIVINCRQFRMHQCTDVVVYLACSSRPIIEDCSEIRFGSYPATYVTPASPLPEPNLYTEIDDFKWIRAEPSPNFSILNPTDQIPDNVWQEINSRSTVPLGVKDILIKVGVIHHTPKAS